VSRPIQPLARSATVEVRCGCSIHSDRGPSRARPVRFHDHDPEVEAVLVALSGEPPQCMAAVKGFRAMRRLEVYFYAYGWPCRPRHATHWVSEVVRDGAARGCNNGLVEGDDPLEGLLQAQLLPSR
jgi:hypothetical protein